MSLPHNSNLSNGQLFYPRYPEAESVQDQREQAALRNRFEPVIEMFQHKGDSECRNGFENQEADPFCSFEKLRPQGDGICPFDEPGGGGMRLTGCVHPLDFVRGILMQGLREADRLGVNPYRLGFIGSTDTHNGTPGHVPSDDFPGHIGIVDDTPVERLGEGNLTHDGVVNNPGGLAGVWAVENSRDAIFEAFRRRETFATSGPRLRPRFFAADALPDGLCEQDDRVLMAYEAGVPMGGELRLEVGDTPHFFVEATADQVPLDRIQIIKGWVNTDGQSQYRVYDVAGEDGPPTDVEAGDCTLRLRALRDSAPDGLTQISIRSKGRCTMHAFLNSPPAAGVR